MRADELGVGQQCAMQVERGGVWQPAEHCDSGGSSRQRQPSPVSVYRSSQHCAQDKYGCQRIDEGHASGGWCWRQGRLCIDTARTYGL